MSMTEDEFEQIVILRESDFQMMGAAISNRSWHDLEAAYNAGRDRLDQTMLDATRWSRPLSLRKAVDGAPKVASDTGAGLREAAFKAGWDKCWCRNPDAPCAIDGGREAAWKAFAALSGPNERSTSAFSAQVGAENAKRSS